jgi:hypothetical protein
VTEFWATEEKVLVELYVLTSFATFRGLRRNVGLPKAEVARTLQEAASVLLKRR